MIIPDLNLLVYAYSSDQTPSITPGPRAGRVVCVGRNPSRFHGLSPLAFSG